MLKQLLKPPDFETIASSLAGMCSALRLVQLLATTGRSSDTLLKAALEPIFIFDPKTPAEVYPHSQLLQFGSTFLLSLLKRTMKPEHRECWRYIIGCIYLAEKIQRKKKLAFNLQAELKKAERQVFYFGLGHENTLATLASIYTDTLGRLPLKIYISGKKIYLQQPMIRNQLRALLLSAVRSAVLWQQAGGRKHQFLFSRERLLKAITHLQSYQSEVLL